MPLWLLSILIEQMPTLQAEEMEAAMTAAMTPHLRPGDRSRLMRRLSAIARPKLEAKPIEVLEHDPEKARAWFEGRGIEVVH